LYRDYGNSPEKVVVLGKMIFHQGSGKVSLLPSADVYTLLRLMVAGPITK